MSTYSDYADRIGRIEQHTGEVQANATANRGSLIGSTIATLGNSIPKQVQEAISQAAERRKQAQIQQIFAQSGGDLHAAIPQLRAIDPELSLKFEKELGAADEVKAKADELKAKHEKETRDFQLGVLAGAQNESQWASGIKGLHDAGVDVSGFDTAYSPEAVKRVNLMLATPDARLKANEVKDPTIDWIETVDGNGKRVKKAVERKAGASFPVPDPQLTPDQVADNARADAQLEISRGQLSVAQQRAQQAQRAAGSQAADITALTPAGLDLAALNYKKHAVMPPLGMGDRTTRQRIINRAGELTPADVARIEAMGNDIAGNAADYKANAASFAALQKQRDAIGAFEGTAKKNIDTFLSVAKDVADTGIPLLNTPVRWVAGASGSANVAKYNAARQVAVSEIARIVQNPNLTGQLSDSARHEIEVFNPANATLRQTIAVMELLKQDMENRKTSLDDQLKETRGRIGSQPGTSPAPAKPVTGRVGPYTYTVKP